MEGIFRTLFTLGVLVFIILIVGLFLLTLKLFLLFTPQIHLLGLTIY